RALPWGCNPRDVGGAAYLRRPAAFGRGGSRGRVTGGRLGIRAADAVHLNAAAGRTPFGRSAVPVVCTLDRLRHHEHLLDAPDPRADVRRPAHRTADFQS